jgi:predicted PurR-regulated permease PerM
MESLRSLLRPLNPRRAILLVVFAGLMLLLRSLLVLLVFFVAFERSLGYLARALARRLQIRQGLALFAVLAVLFTLMALGVSMGTGSATSAFLGARKELPDRIAAFKNTELYQRVQDETQGAEGLLDKAKENAAHVLSYLAAIGHLLAHALIGFILAVVYLMEESELEGFMRELDPGSMGGTLLRWLGYAADAVSVTMQFQLVVAACNAVLTLPLLFWMGIPHVAAFTFMVFVSGMVPVVGNFLSGSVLSLLAYQSQGWSGVALFIGLTVVLHKLESYFLNPRLAARHVRLPGFVLVVSLVMFESLLGFVGLFVSFPFLYLAQRIRREFKDEDAAERAARPGLTAARDFPSVG